MTLEQYDLSSLDGIATKAYERAMGEACKHNLVEETKRGGLCLECGALLSCWYGLLKKFYVKTGT